MFPCWISSSARDLVFMLHLTSSPRPLEANSRRLLLSLEEIASVRVSRSSRTSGDSGFLEWANQRIDWRESCDNSFEEGWEVSEAILKRIGKIFEYSFA